MTKQDREDRARKKKRIRRKKILIIVEVVVLGCLAIAAFGSSWLRNKLNLVERSNLNQDDLITAQEANDGEKTDTNLTGKEMICLVGIDTRGSNTQANSDTMIMASIDHDNKSIKLVSLYRDTYLNVGDDKYYKANSAYNRGGPVQMLNMINLNLDLNIEEYATVQFQAVADTIELLGGVDIPLSRAEMKNINKINVETAHVTGIDYVELEVPSEEELPGDETRMTHLDGAQGLTYARIRYTAGNDFRRAARQRVLIETIMKDCKDASLSTLNKIIDKVLPQVTTNMSNKKILSMFRPLLSYKIEGQVGFPFEHYDDDSTLTGIWSVVPVTLETNVRELHKYLYPDSTYTPSETMKKYSDHIINETGLDETKIPEKSEDGTLPWQQSDESTESASSSSTVSSEDGSGSE